MFIIVTLQKLQVCSAVVPILITTTFKQLDKLLDEYAPRDYQFFAFHMAGNFYRHFPIKLNGLAYRQSIRGLAVLEAS